MQYQHQQHHRRGRFTFGGWLSALICCIGVVVVFVIIARLAWFFVCLLLPGGVLCVVCLCVLCAKFSGSSVRPPASLNPLHLLQPLLFLSRSALLARRLTFCGHPDCRCCRTRSHRSRQCTGNSPPRDAPVNEINITLYIHNEQVIYALASRT